MKTFFLAMLALLVFTVTAEAAPVRIVRLPIIFHSTKPDRDTCAELEMKIARAVHVPMNKTLRVAEYIPTDYSTEALNDIWHRLRAENKRAKLVDAMKPLARELDADIVVCPVLLQYRQRVADSSTFGDTIIDSYARFQLIVYDRRTDNLIDKKSAQFYHESYHPLGTASALAKTCLDKVIDDTELHELIRAIK